MMTIFSTWDAAAMTKIQKREDKFRVYQFLMGLNQEYDTVRQHILQRDPFPIFQQAYSSMHKEDSRQKLMIQAPTTERFPLVTSFAI